MTLVFNDLRRQSAALLLSLESISSITWLRTALRCILSPPSIQNQPWAGHINCGSELMPHCKGHCVPVFGEHRFGARSISFSCFFGISSLRRWKRAVPGRYCNMWIDGSDIRFMHCTLPEMKYMFHALYTHVSDRTPGNDIAYGTADELRKRSYMYHVRRLLAESEIKHAGTCRGWCI